MASRKGTTQQSFNPRKVSPSKALFKIADYEKLGLRADEVSELKESFDLFDIQGSGFIDSRQLLSAMQELGYQSANWTLFKMISNMTDQHQSLDFAKFVECMTARKTLGTDRKNLANVFKLFDDDNIGFISVNFLKRIIREIGMNIDESEIVEMIDRADIDKDGLINEEEFYLIMTKKARE